MPKEINVILSDYPNVVELCKTLKCQIPTQIALLPRNFDIATTKDELLHEREAPTVRILFRKANITETPIETPGERFPQIAHNSYQDWIAPILFLSYSALTQNPTLLNLSLGIIANYLSDLFKGMAAHRGVKIDIVVETKKGVYKKVQYQGSIDGLQSLIDVVQKVVGDE
jgi:hypothetical protein